MKIKLFKYLRRIKFSPLTWDNSTNRSLRFQLIAVLLGITLIPLSLVSLVIFSQTIRNIEEEKEHTMLAYAEGMSNNIDLQIEGADNLLKVLQAQSDIMVALEDYNVDKKLDDIVRYNSILMTLKNVVNNSEGLYEAIFIAGEDGKILIDGSHYRHIYRDSLYHNMDEFAKLKESKKMGVGVAFKSEATGRFLLPISRPIQSLSGFLGMVTILFDLNEFNEGINFITMGETGSVYVIDQDGKYLYHNDSTLIFEETHIKDLETYLTNHKGEEAIFKVIEENTLHKAAAFTASEFTPWIMGLDMDHYEFTAGSKAFRNFITWVMLVITGIVVILSVLFANSIISPVKKIIEAMKMLEKGQLSQTLKFRAASEILALKKGFDGMTHNLKNLIHQIAEASKQVGEASKNLFAASQNALAIGNESHQIMSEIAEGMSEQAKQTKEATNNIEELALSIKHVKDFSEEIKETALTMNLKIDEGTQTVGVLKQKSEDSYEMTKMIDRIIGLLNEEITEVNKIAHTISNIAKKTNLLALNAAIEAARAGEAGKGFAVVANEIKELADQAAVEARDIHGIITNVQNKAEESAAHIKETHHTVEEQNKAVFKTQKAFQSVETAVKEITEKVELITTTLQAMDMEKEDIVKSIHDIYEISKRSAEASLKVKNRATQQVEINEHVSNYAEELNFLADQLQGCIKIFRYDIVKEEVPKNNQYLLVNET